MKASELEQNGDLQLQLINTEVVENADSHSTGGNDSKEHTQYLHGARLHLTVATLSLCLFLTSVEIPIITTSLISIAGDLGSLNKIYWISTAYLLGYAGLLVLSAKFSDIFGRKSCLLVALGSFVIFSAACGAAQTMNQLIVFRALQGLSGAGNYSICTIIIIEMVPPEQYAKYTSFVSLVFVFSLLFGPIWGGAITQHSTWRWVFLLNVPAGVTGALSLIFVLPNRFPHHNKPRENNNFSFLSSARETFRRVDIIGATLLLAATLLLVTGLDEANEQFSWHSGFTIALLTISGILWIVFTFWERQVTRREGRMEPVFPWRFFQNRVWAAMLLNMLCLGVVWFVTMFELPQRFETVNELSPFHAAIRFIPFTVASPVGSVLSPTIGKKFKVPLVYLLLVGSVIQIIAYALLGTVPSQKGIPKEEYGYQVLAGIGVGISTPLLTLMTPFATEKRDHAVAMGAIAQFRTMGGCIGLAIVTAVHNSYLRSHLGQFLGSSTVESLLQSTEAISTLSPSTQEMVRGIENSSYNIAMKILAGFAGGQFLATLLMWQKDPILA